MPEVTLIGADDAPLLARPLYARGDPGALVASLAHVPELLEVTLPFVSRVLGASALDARTKEIVVLRTSVDLSCRFCVQTHTVIALDSGLTRDEVVALREGRTLPDHAALVAFTDAVALGRGPVDAKIVADLRDRYDEAGLVELTLLVGATLLLNRYCTALDLPTAPARLARLEKEGLS